MCTHKSIDGDLYMIVYRSSRPRFIHKMTIFRFIGGIPDIIIICFTGLVFHFFVVRPALLLAGVNDARSCVSVRKKYGNTSRRCGKDGALLRSCPVLVSANTKRRIPKTLH